ncbi:hypothetical protein O3P69_008023 [Scylla paramamosain]|uniref:G-protein coupled receptors family 1 profile domain-containing protein n=1 Tax=Scylla paramamosain TaxID=85552 RepID=A0AAW0T0R6_SCYPA
MATADGNDQQANETQTDRRTGCETQCKDRDRVGCESLTRVFVGTQRVWPSELHNRYHIRLFSSPQGTHFTSATNHSSSGYSLLHVDIPAKYSSKSQVIVYPTKQSLKTVGAVLLLLLIWAVAFILALPNFIWRTHRHHVINLPGLYSVNFCFEEWPTKHGGGYYSVFVMLVQYCLPIVTVSVAYAMICRKLKFRLTKSNVRSSKRSERDDRRMKKTNTLLIAIALVFCLSWLPLNLYNLIVDFCNPFGEDLETMLVVYAVCHMMGMSSACSNPLLYGWLNDNFKKEFLEIISILLPGRARVSSSPRGEEITKLPSASQGRPAEERPMVMYTKASESQVNGNHGTSPKEITYIKQVVTNATL